RTLGAGEWRTFLRVLLPLARPAVIAGVVLTFARALGEFGATLMLAGNIPGRTQTIPVAIFFAGDGGGTCFDVYDCSCSRSRSTVLIDGVYRQRRVLPRGQGAVCGIRRK